MCLTGEDEVVSEKHKSALTPASSGTTPLAPTQNTPSAATPDSPDPKRRNSDLVLQSCHSSAAARLAQAHAKPAPGFWESFKACATNPAFMGISMGQALDGFTITGFAVRPLETLCSCVPISQSSVIPRRLFYRKPCKRCTRSQPPTPHFLLVWW
jgi:hypothetical protein